MPNGLLTESERDFINGEKQDIEDPRGYKSNVLYRLKQRSGRILDDLEELRSANLEAYEEFADEDDPNAEFEEFVSDFEDEFDREKELERRIERLEAELEAVRSDQEDA